MEEERKKLRMSDERLENREQILGGKSWEGRRKVCMCQTNE